ncbi:hypothetical protein [Limosilactobacillus reuteri]|uniref:hypothetical protein n=1 Tax=Limosilactobacillus reuteri TaxID=1598 RepID=UPI0039907238
MTVAETLRPKRERKDQLIQIRVTPTQKKLIKKLAKQNESTVSDLFTDAMIVYAEEKLKEIETK